MRRSEKTSYRESLIAGQSARLICGYIYANAGEGESTTDLVFGGHNIIAENGTTLVSSDRFTNEVIYTELDVKSMLSERRKEYNIPDRKRKNADPYSIFNSCGRDGTYQKICFQTVCSKCDGRENIRCEEILTIQAMGLKKRLAHTHAKSAVVGIFRRTGFYTCASCDRKGI